jgi:hypothetical protein
VHRPPHASRDNPRLCSQVQSGRFRVISVALCPQQDFPSQQVYGPTPGPTLRLVTCGGDFDTQTHLYLDRTIAFALYAGKN